MKYNDLIRAINRLLFTTLFITLLLFPVLLQGQTAENRYPLDTLYHRPEDILPALRERVEMHPGLASWEVLGESSNEKIPIYGLRISNSLTGDSESKPSILFHGQHHGEEPIGVEIVLFMSRFFLERYGRDDFVTYLVDNYNLWFVPTMNPEGFRIVNHGIYRLKRKNNTDTNMNGIFEKRLDGVDMNRNYPFNWDQDEMDDPESPYFKGHEAASQSEIRTMMRFYERERFQLAFFYHSSASGAYSERIFFPWRWGENVSPDYEELRHLALTLASNLPRAYSGGNYSVHQLNTSPRGFARDYIYSQHGTLSMLIEVGGNSPYGEGVINPPNIVLQRLKRKHTDGMLKLLREFDKNLLTGRVLDRDENHLADREVFFEIKQSPYKKNPRTNDKGYFFYYLLPQEAAYDINIEGHEFAIIKDSDKMNDLVFHVDKKRETDPFLKEHLNNGEAIIMTNPVFQYFSPLAFNDSYQDVPEEIYITLLDNQKILHRSKLSERNGLFNLPWIPTDLTHNASLVFQKRDIHPAIDRESLSNRIIFLQNESEVLSYAARYNRFESWYLHPGTMLGIDYTLYSAGENDYTITEIRIIGDREFRPNDLELTLYAGAERIFRSDSFHTTGDYVSFQINDLALPDDLFLIIANQGMAPLSIYPEGGKNAPSERMFAYYSSWVPLPVRDLAIEIRLEKKR